MSNMTQGRVIITYYKGEVMKFIDAEGKVLTIDLYKTWSIPQEHVDVINSLELEAKLDEIRLYISKELSKSQIYNISKG